MNLALFQAVLRSKESGAYPHRSPTSPAILTPMKHDWLNAEPGQEEMIASFGSARIIKHLNGRLEIRGGTEAEKAQAHAWMKQFLDPAPFKLRRVG